ncbi:MAG: TetR/AcrR family transcriptional regulator, partial [Pseudomonadales bacterium]|nr:TetR/AcrR family transcriptional regulator [Pseudomonadales bacterium]
MKQGIRATGIDTILAESGISKKTLYNHFKSKDELIIAALQARDEALLAHLKDRVVFF